MSMYHFFLLLQVRAPLQICHDQDGTEYEMHGKVETWTNQVRMAREAD